MRVVHARDLLVVDRQDYRRAGVTLVEELEAVLVRDGVSFLVPDTSIGWDRTAFLNLTYWEAGTAELLVSRQVTGDQLAHVAWHHLAKKRLGATSRDAALFGEAVAAAFDVYAIGMLLRRSSLSTSLLLATQVPRMAERAKDAGLSARGFQKLLRGMAARPEEAFESLRELLFDAGCALVGYDSLRRAHAALATFAKHSLWPILLHYELSNCVLHTKAHARHRRSPRVWTLDKTLRTSRAPLSDLAHAWL